MHHVRVFFRQVLLASCVALAACASADGDGQHQGSVAEEELSTISGIRMGEYRLDQTRRFIEPFDTDFRKRQPGSIAKLTLSREPSPVGRHGSFTGTFYVAGEGERVGEKTIRGGFKTTKRGEQVWIELTADSGERIGKYGVVFIDDTIVFTYEPRARESIEIYLDFYDPSQPAPERLRCVTRRVNEGVFDGDLSDDEAVTVEKQAQSGKWRATIGSYGFTDGSPDGETVSVTREGQRTTVIISSAGEYKHTIAVDGATGTIHTGEGRSPEKISDLHRCRYE